jgi:predicted RNA-binding protein
MTNIEEVLKEINDLENWGYIYSLQRVKYAELEVADFKEVGEDLKEKLEQLVRKALTQQEELHRKELESIEEVILEHFSDNTNLFFTKHQDGRTTFHDSLKEKIKSIINNKLK